MSTLSFLAGIGSTVIFAASALPMLVKAYRTRDLSSYSLGNILLSNLGNAVHSIYVFSLPPGPLWVLHSFYVLSTGLMLTWFLRYCGWRRRSSGKTVGDTVARCGVREPTHATRLADASFARREPASLSPSVLMSMSHQRETGSTP